MESNSAEFTSSEKCYIIRKRLNIDQRYFFWVSITAGFVFLPRFHLF